MELFKKFELKVAFQIVLLLKQLPVEHGVTE